MKDSKYIDHTALKPDTTKEQIIKLCREAAEYDFASMHRHRFPARRYERKGEGI